MCRRAQKLGPYAFACHVEGGWLQWFSVVLKGWKPFAVAGLWQVWKGSDPPLESCIILTTRANELLAKLHNRIPVILSRNDYDVWIDPAIDNPAKLEYLYEPYPARDMVSRPDNPKVNNARNEGPELISPIG